MDQKTPKSTLNLTFIDANKKAHHLSPKYFQDDLNPETVKNIMTNISKLTKLFEIKDSKGNIIHPYEQVKSAEYVTKTTKSIF